MRQQEKFHTRMGKLDKQQNRPPRTFKQPSGYFHTVYMTAYNKAKAKAQS